MHAGEMQSHPPPISSKQGESAVHRRPSVCCISPRPHVNGNGKRLAQWTHPAVDALCARGTAAAAAAVSTLLLLDGRKLSNEHIALKECSPACCPEQLIPIAVSPACGVAQLAQAVVHGVKDDSRARWQEELECTALQPCPRR